MRILSWVIAIPLGLALVGLPARELGYLTVSDLLDVLGGEGVERFMPLVVIVLLWAVATTLLVEILVEGGRWWMLRRRTQDTRPARQPRHRDSPSPRFDATPDRRPGAAMRRVSSSGLPAVPPPRRRSRPGRAPSG